MSGAAAQWRLFLLALQFMTRLPVPARLPFSETLQARATRYFPAVGLVVGALGALALWAGAQIWPAPLAVLISLGVTVIATGALHEDGLADAADGLIGGATRERALDIMRDSRIGSFGALALGLALAIKVAALSSLSIAVACGAVVLAHVLGRAAAVAVMSADGYARPEGAKFKPPALARTDVAVALGTAALAALCVAPWLGGAVLAGVVGGAVLGLGFRRYFLGKLGGYTGDCLGALQQLVEIGVYLGVAAWL